MELTGLQEIEKERKDQIEKYGYTGEHHIKHPMDYDIGQLLIASRKLTNYKENGLIQQNTEDSPPFMWDKDWWKKLCKKSYKERLAIAGAMIAAELDRLKALDSNGV